MIYYFNYKHGWQDQMSRLTHAVVTLIVYHNILHLWSTVDHGYNEFIMSQIMLNFCSQMTTYYINFHGYSESLF